MQLAKSVAVASFATRMASQAHMPSNTPATSLSCVTYATPDAKASYCTCRVSLVVRSFVDVRALILFFHLLNQRKQALSRWW